MCRLAQLSPDQDSNKPPQPSLVSTGLGNGETQLLFMPLPKTNPSDLTMGMPDNPADAVPDDEAPGAPEVEPDADDAGMAGEVRVPLDSLSEPDEKDEMTPPGEGDKGQANIEYTVNRVEGVDAYIRLDAVNGNKLDQGAAPGSGDDAEMAQLQGMAGQQPERY